MPDDTNPTDPNAHNGKEQDAAGNDVVVLEGRQVQPRRRNDVDVRPRASLPTPVKRIATAVAVGAAMQIGLGIAGKYLAAQAGKKAAKGLLPRGGRDRDTRSPDSSWNDAGAVSETVIIRRVWVRRNR